MATPQVCHILIGVPASGKSTLAQSLAHYGYGRLVSTDRIRHQLYGDEQIQGNWSVIETEVFRRVINILEAGESVIYDATNAKRAWRLSFLQGLQGRLSQEQWQTLRRVAWYLQTPVTLCQRRNQQRTRVVPASVITSLNQALQQFPPIHAEGFEQVISLTANHQWTQADLEQKLHKVDRSQINRQNRTQQLTWHSYSQLLDFERLLHLLSLILEYPGMGEHDQHQPGNNFWNKNLDVITEITRLMVNKKGNIYGDKNRIIADLQWLKINGFFSQNYPAELYLSEISDITISPHAYSDREPFTRLFKTIRLILHHPLLLPENGALETLIQELQTQEIIQGKEESVIRKDIEKILKPYKILPSFSLRQGYFAGTAILSKSELQQVLRVLQSQADSLEDPTALHIYEMLKRRMQASQLTPPADYPVRAIANRCMVDWDILPNTTLARDMESLEQGILAGELWELNHRVTGGKFPTDPKDFFQAWPLQLIFYNFAWYLGMEIVVPGDLNYFRVQRLDRLFRGNPTHQNRSLNEGKEALQQLERLLQTSPGVFFGNNGKIQQQWLSQDVKERRLATVIVELWFSDPIYRFIVEKTKRFPPQQMKLSPLTDAGVDPKLQKLFCLKPNPDSEFPHRVQLKLPKWSLADVDFRRWVLGFGGGIKVVKPLEFQSEIKKIAEEILKGYSTP